MVMGQAAMTTTDGRHEHPRSHRGRARPRPGRGSWRSELRAIKIVWRRELIRFARDRMRIVTSLVQPLLFLFVLGTGPAAALRARAPTAST